MGDATGRRARIGSFAGRALKFWKGSANWRRRFGTVGGFRLAVALRADYTLTPGSCFAVDIPGLPHPLSLRAASADTDVLAQHCVGDDLRFPVSRHPEYILDAGANIGLASAIFAARFPGARILAVEPEAGNFAMLLRNAAAYPGILPLQAAVWSRDATVEFRAPKRGHEHRVRVHEPAPAGSPPGETHRVEAWSISSLLARTGWPRFDLVKLDIEGAEAEVLGNGELGWLDSVSELVVELHDRFRPGCREAFSHALQGRGFRLSASGEYQLAERVWTEGARRAGTPVSDASRPAF